MVLPTFDLAHPPPCDFQVKGIRSVMDMPDHARLKQWIRLCLNHGTLVSCLQLLSGFDQITRCGSCNAMPA